MNHLNEVFHYNKSSKRTNSLKWISFANVLSFYMVTTVVRSSLITGKATVFWKQLLALLENVVKLAESLCSLPNIAKQLSFWLHRKLRLTHKTNECFHTFQVIDRFFQFGHRPLCKLCTGLGLINTIRVLKELKKHIQYEKGQLIFDLVSFTDFFTSFSLSLRTLISSSYLSSFSEYWNTQTKTDTANPFHFPVNIE